MAAADTAVRQSVSLPSRVARRIKALAKKRRSSASRVIVELIESGLEAQEQERRRFLELADRLTHTDDPGDAKRIKEELARMTFGS